MPTDAELLRRYVHENAEEAFAEFVRRHVGLVYSAALRRLNGRTHLAEEVAQMVFSDLSRKSAALCRHPSLSAWLYRSTRYAAIDALRAEQRRQILAQSFSSMHHDFSEPETQADWEKLRPVLDDAMDGLKDRERELMLLRFFEGLSFAEIGEKLGLSENAARKRTERSLDRLRTLLGKRGIASTASALSLLLSHQALASAPAGVTASVTAAALTSPPATGLAGLLTTLLLHKLTAPALSAVLAASLSAILWHSFLPPLGGELACLQGEYRRLLEANSAQSPSANRNAVIQDYADQATVIAGSFAQARSASATRPPATLSPHGYEYRGQASAEDAVLSFAWACDVADPEVLAKLVLLEDHTQAMAANVLGSMPEGVRAQCRTPEDFYGMLLAASCLEAPPPDAAIARRLMKLVVLGPDRVATRMIGSSVNFHEFQRTPAGWKYVLPAGAVETLPGILGSRTLAARAGKH